MIEQSLRTIILDDSTLSGLLAAGGVYPSFLPQGKATPCIVYQFEGPMPPLTAGGVHTVERYTVTLKVFSETYGPTRDISKALVTLLNGLSTTQGSTVIVSSRVLNVFSDYEDTLEMHTAIIDLSLHATE